MIILEILVLLVFVFTIGGFIYEASGLFKRFYHDIIGWHKPGNHTPIVIEHGVEKSRCEFCGKRILRDRYGNWY